MLISLFPSGCRQGLLTKSSSVRKACHDQGSDRQGSNPNALLVVSISGSSVGCSNTAVSQVFGSLRAIMERRCGGGRLVREIQYKNTSYSSRSRICMHTLHRKAKVLLYLMVLFVFHFFSQGCFFLFFPPRSRSFFLPSLRGRGRAGWGGTWGVLD